MHFNITKPQSNDYFSLGVMNDNYDEIDDVMYANQQSAAKVMVGATSLADGESGRVPAPTSADRTKYLKGDGTWDTPSGGGGGGSSVTITPTLSSGTKIADYSIDGASGSLYAPSGGGGGGSHTYSTTEQIVGTWIDGSDVYEKSFEIQITSTDPIIIEQDASYIDALLSFDGSCKSSGGLIAGVGMPVSTGWCFAVHRNASNQLILYGNPTAVSNGTAYITIRYTKTGGNS